MTSKEQLTGHTTVQASAGSGKTYLLISRIVRLLLSGAEAGNIMAITFTRKAANEMQSRLLERLFEMATVDENSLKKTLSDLQLDANSKTINQCRGLYEKILRSESPVKTSTFHAFCQELLRRFPMEANVSPGFDLLDKTTLLYDEAWDALMAEANENTTGPLASALQFLFKELGLYNSKKALTNFLENRSDWWAYTKNKTSPILFANENLDKQLNIEPNIDPINDLFNDESSITLLNEFHVLLCKHDTSTNLKTSEDIYKIIDENISQSLRYKLFNKCFLTQAGLPRKRAESKAAEKKMGVDGQTRFIELHNILSEKLINANSQLAAIRTKETSSAWYLAGKDYLKHFQKIKKEQRVLDFTDLEWQTYLLLNHSNNALWVQYKLDQRIEHLLIDEFQDTNPTQWRLILPLLEEMASTNDERQRSVFIVGDEKQSIYRFRRAEPRLFTAAEKWLKENLNATTCPLSHSWRSSPAIINFVNQIFSQDKFKVLLPSFIEHKTHRETLAGKVTILPLSLKEIKTKEETSDIPIVMRNPLNEPRRESINQQYFNEGLMIAKEIKKLIKEKRSVEKSGGNEVINYNDIIILLRSRTHVADYERAFRQVEIPYIGANRGTLLESLEVNDMLDLLQWLILPFDNLALAGILRSPLFSVSNKDLIEIKQASKGTWLERIKYYIQEEPDHKILPRAYELLMQWQEDASKLPVHDLLDKIYSEANVLERYVAAFPAHLGQRVTSNLNRFLELALEMDSGRYPSLTRFSSWINELRQLEKEAPDEPVTSNENEQRVKILTVHSAKGLEAPIVFLADSASSPTNKRAYSTLIDWPAENEKPEYFLLTTAKDNLDEFSKNCIKEQDFFEQRENANLLYVALTRAKQMLYISGSEPKSKDHGWYGNICAAYDFSSTENKEAILIESIGEIQTGNLVQQNKDVPHSVIPAGLSLPIQIDKQQIDISPSQQLLHSNSQFNSNEENTIRGIVMHQMLNDLSRFPKKTFSEFHSIESNEINTADLEKWWLECEKTIKSKELSKLFDHKYYDIFHNEVPIQFKDDTNMVYGIIDRLIIKDNHVTIIDYKTHPYATNENIDDISKTYQQQMQLYKKGVQLLWPEYNVTSKLLYTAVPILYEL